MNLRMIVWAVLGLALSYQVHSQEAIRGLPCIQRLHQLFCRNQGNTYPSERIESFIDLNKALTRRMFGEFQAEEVSFPAIQQFRTVDFPQHLRPKDGREPPVTVTGRISVTGRTSVRRRGRERFEAARARLREARAQAGASATRVTAARKSAPRRAMTPVKPTRVLTQTPLKRTATRPPFAGNVFLSGGEELIAAASQPTARYPRREPAPANQRAAVRAESAHLPITGSRRNCGQGRGCAVVAPPGGDRGYYRYAEPENPLEMQEGGFSTERRYSYPTPEQPLSLSERQRFKRSPSASNNTAADDADDVRTGRFRRQSFSSSVSRQPIPAPPKIDRGSKHLVDSCESKIEITTPFWAANSAGEIRAIVNTKHFPQAIHQEICKATKTSRCSGECRCEQKYTYHRLLAYDPDDDCRGIFIDWFLFPSCCACRCPP